jgi:hypothetical protein
MTPAEAAHFETDPYFTLYIRMRQWDEAAKDPSVPPPDLSVFRAKIVQYLTEIKNPASRRLAGLVAELKYLNKHKLY